MKMRLETVVDKIKKEIKKKKKKIGDTNEIS